MRVAAVSLAAVSLLVLFAWLTDRAVIQLVEATLR